MKLPHILSALGANVLRLVLAPGERFLAPHAGNVFEWKNKQGSAHAETVRRALVSVINELVILARKLLTSLGS